MALRSKTIEYAYPFATTNVNGGATRTFTTITIYIPETTSRTFRSVILEMSVADNVSAATSPTNCIMGISLGAVANNTTTVTQGIANSGEATFWIYTRDVTSYFATNFGSGTSQTSACTLSIGVSNTINASAKVIITYEYEDSSATTRVKTVKIPIDGNTGALTTTAANIGAANQVPNLDTFLPESSKVYRDIFFESHSHMGLQSGSVVSASITMTYTLAGVATDRTSGLYDMNLSTDRNFKRIDKIETLTTNAQSSIAARSSNIAAVTAPCLCGVLVVTYEYDHSVSSSIMNSLQIPLIMDNVSMWGTVDADRSLFRSQFFIEEPATITLAQSGILLTNLDGGSPLAYTVNCGTQTNRTFTQNGGLNACGYRAITRRIDSGAQGGAGITLARGLNTIDVEYLSSLASSGLNPIGNSVMLFLNYTSGKHSDGDGAHAHTVIYSTKGYGIAPASQALAVTPSTQVNIPETNYHIISSGYEYINISHGTLGSWFFTHSAKYLAGEGTATGATGPQGPFGSKEMAVLAYNNVDAESGVTLSWCPTDKIYRNYYDPNYPNKDQFDIESSRSHIISAPLTQSIMINQYVTYNSITYTISGTISGSNGGAVTIEAYRADTGRQISSTSRTGNGSYSMTWYDNTINVFVVAYESSTYKGVSAEQVAGNTFDINLSSGGGPTYYSYA